ncbi:MAG: hypothetical protein VX288_08960, partial [Planctomycetota bacterium]|nr:hypothetical protein [Planctomycetota bacterium]
QLPGIFGLELGSIHLQENARGYRQQLLTRNRNTETKNLESLRTEQGLNRALAAILLVVLENEKLDSLAHL